MTPVAVRKTYRPLGVSALLVLLALTACNDEEKGTTLGFEVIHHAGVDSLGNIPDHHEPTARVFTTDQGYQVTLTQGYFVVAAVEILPAASVSARSPLFGILDRLIPAADAHSEASPTRLGEPNVIDLLAPDLVTRELGHIEPPPGAYGKMRITWAPADDDAGFLPPDFDMVGQTLRLAGQAVKGTDTLDFVVADAATDSVEVFFITDSEHEAPGWLGVSNDRLNLAAGEETSVGIGTTYSTWFEGVNFQAMSTTAIHARVMENIRASIGYHSLTGEHGHHRPGTNWPTGG